MLCTVPDLLIFGRATPAWGEREVAVKAVSRPVRAARAAPVGDVWSELEGETGETGSMKGSLVKVRSGRVYVDPGGAFRT